MNNRNFVTLLDLDRSELRAVIDRAQVLKAEVRSGVRNDIFRNKTLAMIFDKSSTRTRVSFETAMTQCGGNAIFLSSQSTQLGRGEPIEDTARVISSMTDAIVIRTVEHEMVERFAANSRVPVINGLTDIYHPCQLLADLQTWFERNGEIEGRKVAWLGDGNNMCHSWMNAAHSFNFSLHVATPPGFEPRPEVFEITKGNVTCVHEPESATRDADIVVTDAWYGLGQEQQAEDRKAVFEPFRVDQRIMGLARSDAIFMHCLPAYRGQEVTEDVLEGPQSVVWNQAENRLHAQKALLEFLMC